MEIHRICKGRDLTVFDSFASPEDDGAPQETQTTVEKKH